LIIHVQRVECNGSAEYMKHFSCHVKHFGRYESSFTTDIEFAKPIYDVNVIKFSNTNLETQNFFFQLQVIFKKKKSNNEFYILYKAEFNYCELYNVKVIKNLATAFMQYARIIFPELVTPCPLTVMKM
jgi:hypothetical protein